jgi:hypothetical protein
MRNKTTEVTEGHRERVFGIIEYIREEVAFVQVTYARLLSCCTFGDGEAELIVPLFHSLRYIYRHLGKPAAHHDWRLR